MTNKRVGILIFPAVEVLDFCGPYEVFSVTRLDEERRREESSPFEVFLVAQSAEPVVATGGLRVIPDVTLETCPPLEILVVPGGWGTRKEISNQRLLTWICAREAGRNTHIGLHRRHAARAGRLARWPAGNHALALARLDAAVVPGCHCRGQASRRRGRPRTDVSWDLSRYRHGAARGGPLLRRSSRSGDSAPHGISVSR
jgi:DJ-1/PfpI family